MAGENCRVKLTWQTEFTADQIALISRSLRQCLRPEDVTAAKILGDQLSIMRAKYVLHLANENEKLIKSLVEAGLWEHDEEEIRRRRLPYGSKSKGQKDSSN